LIFGGRLPESDTAPFFELSSLLLGNGTMDEVTQLSHLQALIHPVMTSIDAMLQSSAMVSEPATTGDRLTVKLNILAMATKGSTKPVQHLRLPYEQIMIKSIEVLSRLPNHNGLLSKFMIVMHRMVVCLEPQTFLSYMPQVMPLLVAAWKACDVEEFDAHLDMLVPFLNQLMIRFESNMFPLLDVYLIPILHHASSLWIPARELNSSHVQIPSIQTHYFSLVHHVVTHQLSTVLCSPNNLTHLGGVLLVVTAGIEQHADPAIKRRCLGIITSLMNSWLMEGGPVDLTFFISFITEKVVPSAFRCIYSPQLKPLKDANASRVVTEVAKLLYDMHMRVGPRFIQQLTVILAQSNFSRDLVQRLESVFVEGTSAQIVDKTLREFIV
jgi:hypothetical protein